jgi:carbonic anhydrase
VAPTNSTAQSGMTGYALCSSSSKQSPINIAEQMAVYDATLLPLSLKYGDTESWTMEVTANYLEAAELETATTGSGLATLDTQTDGVVVDGVFVPLNQVRAAARLPVAAALIRPRAQFHFHSPSEHTINGKHYPLEMHMVHKLFTSDGTLGGTVTNSAGKMAKAAVIGIMFEYSPTDADGDFLSKFQPVFQNMRQFKQFDSTNIEVEDEDAQFSLMDDVFGVIGTDQYYHYNGSLTTVNCYDSISWFNSALPALALTSPALLTRILRMCHTHALALRSGQRAAHLLQAAAVVLLGAGSAAGRQLPRRRQPPDPAHQRPPDQHELRGRRARPGERRPRV